MRSVAGLIGRTSIGRGWRWASLIGRTLVFAAGPACVLFVNDDPGSIGTTCTFGDKTDAGPCGACLAKNCQTAINSCCVAPNCRDRGMAAVDDCARGNAKSCLSSDVSSEVQSCITSSCPKECLGGITDCRSGTYECTCSIDTYSPNDVKCTTATVRNSICCASMSWPSSVSSCHCTYWGCNLSMTSCDCSLRNYVGSTSDYKDACYFTGGHCCRSNSSGFCGCQVSPCTASETEVPDCSLMNAGCGSYEKQVTECAP